MIKTLGESESHAVIGGSAVSTELHVSTYRDGRGGRSSVVKIYPNDESYL